MSDSLPALGSCVLGFGILYIMRRGTVTGFAVRPDTMVLWVLSAAIITVVLYALFGSDSGGGAWTFLGIRVEYAALTLGLTMASKLATLLLLSTLLLAHVAPLTLATGMTRLVAPLRRVGIPVANLFYLAFFLSRMAPSLISESRMIIMAQRSRGVSLKRWRSYPAIALPMFAAALRRSDAAALVLASRGFDSRRLPASVLELSFSALDVVVICALASIWMIWLALFLR